MILRAFILLLLLSNGARPASAQAFVHIDLKSAIICENILTDEIPTFSDSACRALDKHAINLHQRQVWIKASIDVPENLLNQGRPLGLFVSAKASSAFYLNGELLGQNGVPSATANTEAIGMMDTVFYLPKEKIRLGENTLTFRMSSHHGYITLANPIHWIAIAPYAEPSSVILQDYLPSFLPLGILVVGALYFGFLAIKHRDDKSMMLIPFVAFFAAGQLIAEVSRGAFPYAYPFHDIRLMLILSCALASGACLLLHIVDRFIETRKLLAVTVAYAVALIPVLLTSGFDGKSLFALQGTAAIGALIAIYAAGERKPKAMAYAVALLLFSLTIYLAPNQFLDIYFYYVVAGLLLFLFAQQIQILTQEKDLRAAEQARADRLQIILDESQEKICPSTIKVAEAGKVNLISTDQVVFCKGARDYVELTITDKKTILHTETLNKLEENLPSTFLRVHRSYIVNTHFIQSLERDTSGSGTLLLTTEDEVPVSRRIMPRVRKALS